MSKHQNRDDRFPTEETPPIRPRRQPRKGMDINELPVWTWVGILLAVVVIGLGLWGMTHRGDKDAAPESGGTVEPPSVVTGEAPQTEPQAPTQAPAAPGVATPTPIIIAPTATPPLPDHIVVGVRVAVTGTGADKLRVRSGPGTDYATAVIVPDGTEFRVLEGPQSQGGYEWWRLEMTDGTTGWAAGRFLTIIGR